MTLVHTDSVLDRINAAKVEDLIHEKSEVSIDAMRRAAEAAPRPPDFVTALQQSDLGIIAEFKRRSPSKGTLVSGADAIAVARAYSAAGVDAMSVLTERHFFDGSLDDLSGIGNSVALPLLRKDFLFDPYHLYQAKAVGASAVLLIVAMLEISALTDLIALAKELGITPLVEVHTADELTTALKADARVIGINNRDLHTFNVDLAVTERLAPMIPRGRTIIGESGVNTAADVARLRAAGVRAILVGESLMRTSLADVDMKIAEFRAGAAA